MAAPGANATATGAAGLAVRACHTPELLRRRPPLGLAELLADNHMADGGPARWLARDIASCYPVALHAVGTSVGGPDPIDRNYLSKLRALADELGARWVSDHLSFSTWHGRPLHDLLPIPYTEEALRYVAARVHHCQELLQRTMLLENPSRYLPIVAGELDEATFLAELARATGCGLLFDVNNAYVNQVNLGTSADRLIDTLPAADIGYVHIAGHEVRGDHLLDTHGAAVAEPVWNLLARLLARRADLTVVLERDRNQVPLTESLAEVSRAARMIREAGNRAA